MDTQKRASLLREILEERVFDDKAWEALYDRLAKRYGCPYVPGSLCQLQMIERYIKGNKPISVPEKPISVPEKPIKVPEKPISVEFPTNSERGVKGYAACSYSTGDR